MLDAVGQVQQAHMGKDKFASRPSSTNGESERSGFTAVNGDKHRHAAPGLGESADVRVQAKSRPNSNVEQADKNAHAQHCRRANDRNDSVMNAEPASRSSPETAKRKRSDDGPLEAAQREHSMAAGAGSPKRRLTELSVDIDTRSQQPERTTPESSDEVYAYAKKMRAIDSCKTIADHMPLSSNPSNRYDKHMQSSTRQPALTSRRERSPVPMWNQREPPPQVRPETEADLAQSLASHLHSVNQATPAAESPSTAAIAYGERRSQEYSPDTSGGNPGKKKRNFSNRTKTGCHTCRDRKKKCDEAKPICNNCARGNFQCGGYGPKPPNFKGSGSRSRVPVPLQSKQHELPPGPTGHYPLDGPRYDNWGRVPPPPPPAPEPYPRYGSDPTTEDARYPRGRESWHRGPWDSHQPFHLSNTLPPVDFNPPPISYASEPPPPPPHMEKWPHPLLPPHRSQTGAATTISSHESVGTSSSQRAPRHGPLAFPALGQMTEKEKMLLGRPYLHYIDDVLLDDRQQCKTAVERYNNAARPSEAVSSDERSRFFSAVIDPARRPNANPNYRDVAANTASMTRPGRIGYRTIVEAPFNCDYGYNILLGDDIVVGAGCYMQDPCEIIIGNRTIIGPNVKFYGISTSVDPASRKGSQGLLTGGAIVVEDDVFIGGDVIILPHRTIGKGAVIGAGSVVTRNVPAYTVVAGNPAREIRTLAPSGVEDRRMRAAIQAENDQSMRDMRVRRGYRE